MKWQYLSLTLLCSPLIACAQQTHRMPRGAFLIQPARSTKELLAQFDNHPSVQKRYVAAFGRPKGEARYILSQLQPKQLTESHRYPMAYFHGDRWGFKTSTIAKGSIVYVTSEGQPFLKENCGNPLIILPPFHRPPARTSVPVLEIPPAMTPPSYALEIPPALDTPPPGSPILEELATPSLPTAEFVPEGVTPDLEFTPEPSPGRLRTPSLPKKGKPYWLLGIPFLFFLDFGGHGNGPPGSPPPAGGGTGLPPPTQAVPEPAVIAFLLSGGVVLIAFRGRSRRK